MDVKKSSILLRGCLLHNIDYFLRASLYGEICVRASEVGTQPLSKLANMIRGLETLCTDTWTHSEESETFLCIFLGILNIKHVQCSFRDLIGGTTSLRVNLGPGDGA